MKLSTLAIMAFTSLAIAKPIPDGDENDNDSVILVPIRWADAEAEIYAAQSSASVSSADAATATATDTATVSATDSPVVNIAARHAPAGNINHHPKSGAEAGYRGGSGLWGREVKHNHDHEHDHEHDDQHNHNHDSKPETGPANGKNIGPPEGEKSGAEMGGFHRNSHVRGRSPEPKRNSINRKADKKGSVDKEIVGANPFDEGGDHKNDPSWGRDVELS